MNPTLTYQEENHQYFVDGKEVISVTKLLSKHGLAPNYDGIPSDILQKAAERGTLIHAECEDYIRNGTQPMFPESIAFVDWLNEYGVTPIATEVKLYNDVVAGTMDFIGLKENGFIATDHKTTSQVHKETISWQLGIYMYLVRHGYSDGLNIRINDFVESGCTWLRDEKCKFVSIEPKPESEIERLLDCERKGEIYQPRTDLIESIAYEQMKAIENEIVALDNAKKEKEIKLEELKAYFKEQMEKNKLTKVSSVDGVVTVTYVAAVDTLTFDSKQFEAEHPDLYKQYKTKPKHTSAYVKIKVNEVKDNE